MKKHTLSMTVLVVLGLALGAGCRSQKPTKLTSIPGLTPIVKNPTPTNPTGPVNPTGPGPGTSVPGGPTTSKLKSTLSGKSVGGLGGRVVSKNTWLVQSTSPTGDIVYKNSLVPL